MPMFHYLAIDGQGAEVRGAVEAEDPRAAAASLRRQAIYVMQLDGRPDRAAEHAGPHAASSRGRMTRLRRLLPVFARDRIFFLRQTALMIRSGLTLLQSLQVSAEQAWKGRLVAAINRIGSQIHSGKSLSEALRAERRYFTQLDVSLVASAEVSGELEVALERAATHLERRVELRRRLLTSLIYPAIVVMAAVAVSLFLVIKVIPKFATFFENRGTTLPWATQFVVQTSNAFLQYWPWMAATIAVMLAGVTITYRTEQGRNILDRFALRVPLVGKLLTVAACSQLSKTLAMLLASGVTLLESLRIASGVVGNRAISGCVRGAAEEILKGRDLAGSLRKPVLPNLVPSVVAVGERTGALSQVLEELAEFYDRELQARIRRMSAWIEPALILTIGVLVGFVYFAFIQAVLQLAVAGR